MSTRPLLSRDFVLVTVAAAFFMVSFGATLPVLPRYVAGPLEGSDLAVGIVVGSFAVSAIMLRPLIGYLGDQRGRRFLIVGGAAMVSVGMLAHVPSGSVVPLVAARLLVGAGQGTMFVGAATLVNDLAPPDRRGQAASYFSVAIYTGLGLGPFAGETLLRATSYDVVWLAVAAGTGITALLGLLLPRSLPVIDQDAPPPVPRTGFARLLHPKGLGPGVVLFLGMVGFIGFNTFVPLYGQEIGMSDVAGVFLTYAIVVLVVRIAGSRLPDVYGPVVIGTVGLAAGAVGLLGIAVWQAPVGLYLFTVVLAAGSALIYPALMAAAVNSAPDNERSAVVATFTMFFEVATAGGGAVLGLVASQTSYAGAFVAASCFSVAGLAMLHGYLRPRLAVRSAHV
ncbi:MAG: MFS transporter [Acidimicrobiales bacterium]